VFATAALAAILLLMAVTETSLMGHYLIDQGEFIAVIGLVFLAGAGVVLHRTGRLAASMPFALPWLLYPVVTQGDQVIDNLSINWMRLLVHILLALIFAAPVLVLAFGLRQWAATERGRRWCGTRLASWVPGLRLMAGDRWREGLAMFAVFLFSLEFVAAHITLGLLMMGVLVAMVGVTLVWGASEETGTRRARTHADAERRAAALLAIGLVVSGGLYVGYKNRPGAYQGSPSYLLDPAQDAAGYPLGDVPVPVAAPVAPAGDRAAAVTAALDQYAAALDRLVDGYYIAERNYTFDFHNHLFLRSWPVLPRYRAVALDAIAEARGLAASADARPLDLPADDPLAAWVEEVRRYTAFNFQRASVLERLTAEFERTRAGLQHAAHIYEGEGKLVGLGLRDIELKHAMTLRDPAVAPLVAGYLTRSRATYERYSNRIVGF
jgi:hypothetical protein